jgi:3-methyladenine DNA glycosylase/8-oxoguanine DNA glycosylase
MSAHWPTPDEFARMPPAQQELVRERSARSVEEAAAAVEERVAVLKAVGASAAEIVRDLRGDPGVGKKYGLAGAR